MRNLFLCLAFLSVFSSSAFSYTIIKPPEIKFSGYTQIGYTRDDTKPAGGYGFRYEDNFKIQKARLTFKGDIDPMTALTVQFDVAARDTANNTMTVQNMLTDAYFSMKYLKGHTIRLGQFKLPFGLENPVPDSKLYFVNTSVVKNQLINTRDIGVDVGAATERYEYHAALVNGAGANKTDDNAAKQYLLSAQAIVGELRVGGSMLASPGMSTTSTALRKASDFYVQYVSELGEADFEYMNGQDKVLTKKSGWYLSLMPRLNDRTWFVVRTEQYDPSKARATDRVERTTAGLMYLTSKYTRIRLNYEWRKVQGSTLYGDAFQFQWQGEY